MFSGPARFARLSIAAALSAVCALSAHADTISYNLIGVTTSAGAITGTLAIDTLTDRVTAANITFHDAAAGNPVFNKIGSPNSYNGLGQDYISGLSNSPLNYGGQIGLYYDTANIGFGNLNICLFAGPCGMQSNQASVVQAYVSNGGGGPYNILGGSLDPVFGAPAVGAEPQTLVLLGTGILGLAIITRAKVFRT